MTFDGFGSLLGRRGSISSVADLLSAGSISSTALIELCFETWEKNENCRRAFLRTNWADAFEAARRWDVVRTSGGTCPRYAGIPISVKDAFDCKGEVTRAGSKYVDVGPPAASTADAIANLQRQGFIVIGRTHMTEFAYSGLGLNSHYANPWSIWQEVERRIPGGSSSGAAVATALGVGLAGIGTDTGGSCRIPAAFNRLVGFKPTARRISLRGITPLSNSLDSVGAVAHSVECVSIVNRIMAGEAPNLLQEFALPRSLLVPSNFFFDSIEATVSSIFNRTVSLLELAGVRIYREAIPEMEWIPDIVASGGIVAAEAYAWHLKNFSFDQSKYDPRVAARISLGESVSEDQLSYLRLLRDRFTDAIAERINRRGMLFVPTVPIVAPKIDACSSAENYARMNGLVLRNPSIANLIDGCSLSLPISSMLEPPVGAMLIGQALDDDSVISSGQAIERILRYEDSAA